MLPTSAARRADERRLSDRVRWIEALEPSFGHVSTLSEWDDYQFSWTVSLVDRAVREASTTKDRDEVLAVAAEHRESWLSGARGELGFATFVVHDRALE